MRKRVQFEKLGVEAVPLASRRIVRPPKRKKRRFKFDQDTLCYHGVLPVEPEEQVTFDAEPVSTFDTRLNHYYGLPDPTCRRSLSSNPTPPIQSPRPPLPKMATELSSEDSESRSTPELSTDGQRMGLEHSADGHEIQSKSPAMLLDIMRRSRDLNGNKLAAWIAEANGLLGNPRGSHNRDPDKLHGQFLFSKEAWNDAEE